MGKWNKLFLIDLIDTIESGCRPKGGVSQETGDIPSLGGENIFIDGGINLTCVNKITFDFFKKMRKGILKEYDVLINKDGANTGKVGIYYDINFKYASINEHLFLLRAKRYKLTQKFLYYYLLCDFGQNQIKMFISGSAQPGLNLYFAKRLSIEFPESIFEQEKIAEILTKIDKTIDQTESLIDKYKRLKAGLMQDLLAIGIDEKGNIRSENTHEFKDSPLGRIPKEWEVKKLFECCEVCNSLRYPISSQNREKIKGIYPYYGATGILNYINEYRINGKYVLIGEDGDHFLKHKNQEMTILVEGKFNVNNHAHLIKGTDKCTVEWFHLFFSHRDITLYLTRQGAGRFKLNKAALLDLPVLLPDVNEQVRICNYIKVFSNFITNNERTLTKLQRIKTGLMQDLLTGKVSVDKLLKCEVN